MKTLHIKGRVFSGSGEGTKFTELPWVKKQITEKLGFTPHPGTLNMKLIGNHAKLELLKKAQTIEILPEKGFCKGKLFNAILMNEIKCAIVVPEIENYPENILELVAPINLREKLSLKDGDIVQLKIML